jgi:hypothetical protein
MSPEAASKLPLDEVAALTPADIAGASPDSIKALSPKQLEALSDEAQLSLSDEQVEGLNPEQAEALGRSPVVAESDKPVGELKRGRAAIKPGVRLVGDAYSQLVSAAGQATPGGAFGGGAEIETLRGRGTIIVRKGTQPDELSDTKAFGRSMLTPSVQNFFGGVELAHDIIALPGPFTFGVAGGGQIALTSWKPTLVKAVSEVTDDMGNVTTAAAPAVTALTGATTVALNVGPELRFIASQGENYVEIRGYVGFGFRAVDLDEDANQLISDQRAIDSRVTTGGFLKHAIGTDRGVFGAIDAAVSLRINTVVISAAVPYVGGNVPGLSGLNFVPSITLRTGARIIDL